jgi:isopenicillin N synthase-like dioxygenase
MTDIHTERDQLELPLIDLARWRNGNADEQQAIVSEVDRHLQRLGFLMVKNHAINPAIRDAARKAAKDFFLLPIEQKQGYSCPDYAYRGWIAPGLESNAASYAINDPQQKVIDLKEAYSIGPVFEGIDAYKQQSPRWYADNIWPTDHVVGFEKSLTDWWSAANSLTIELLELFCTAVGFDKEWVTENCSHPMATVTANLYPKVAEEGGWRVGAHTDFGTITVLDRDTDNGLEVEVSPENWIDAPKVEGTLIINLGEMMVELTGGRWRANPHRVRAKLGAEANLSLIYFHDPDFDMPLPLKNEHGTSMTAADFLKVKMDQIIQS